MVDVQGAFLIVFTLLALAGWYALVVNVQGAFLNGQFVDKEVLFMEVPELLRGTMGVTRCCVSSEHFTGKNRRRCLRSGKNLCWPSSC